AWAAAAAAAVAADGGSKSVIKESQVGPRRCNHFGLYPEAALLLAFSLTIMLLIAPSAYCAGQTAAETGRPIQKTFSTPKEAADALIQAADVFDAIKLRQLLGPDGEDLVTSKDPVQDKNLAAAFAARAHQQNSIAVDPKDTSRAILLVGNQ